MKNILKISAILFTFVVFAASCNKYEEGPAFSIHTAKHRVSGEWKLEKCLYNSTDITSATQSGLGANAVWEYEKDGKYTFTGTYSDSGTWELGEDKDDIRVTSTVSNTTTTYRILKLKNKEMWFKYTDTNGDLYEYHLIPA